MASGKLTKEDLKQPDFFQSHGTQLAEFILKFQGVFLTIGALILVGGLAWIGISYWQSHRENAATTALYPVEKKIQDEMEKNKTISDAALQDYDKVLRDHSSARSSLVSLISLSPSLIKAGKASWALDEISKAGYQPSNRDVYFGLEKMTQGLLALESQQPDKAAEIYQQLLAQDSQKSFHADALLKLGVAYQMKKDIAKARETFERVRKEHPRTQAGEMAFEYLLALSQQKGA